MNAHPAPVATVSTYRLRPGVWQRIADEQGWETNLAAARALGMSHTQIGRVLAGETSPGERFMAAVMSALSGRPWRHEDVFELVPEEER